jgi:hypothetical protein
VAAALAPHYGIARQHDWPTAAIRAAALGVVTAGGWWLAADPVTLVAGRDDVRLAGRVADLDAAEAAALVATLAAHFAADGLAFVAPRPAAWFVRANTAQTMTTHPPDAALARPLRDLLPEGPDASRWRRWDSEIQMLLHGHPVNAAREARGMAPANGVWFSGGGTHAPPAALAVHTLADGGIAEDYARHLGAPAQRVPADVRTALAALPRAATVVIAVAADRDLASVDPEFAAPAWEALAHGRARRVTVIADGAGAALVWTAARPSALARLRGRLSPPTLDRQLAGTGGDR